MLSYPSNKTGRYAGPVYRDNDIIAGILKNYNSVT